MAWTPTEGKSSSFLEMQAYIVQQLNIIAIGHGKYDTCIYL